MSVNDSGEKQHYWQGQPNVPDNRSHVTVRQRWIFAHAVSMDNIMVRPLRPSRTSIYETEEPCRG